MAASISAGFVHRGILAAHDMGKRFVVTMVMTICLVYRSSLGTFRMVQAIARLVMGSRLWLFVLVVCSRLRLWLWLLSCGVVVLLIPIARSTGVILVRVLRLEITDYGVFVTEFVTYGGRTCATRTGTPIVAGAEFAVQFV